MSLRDRILASSKPAPHALDTSKWGAGNGADWGTVYVRTLTVGEIVMQSEESADDKNKPSLARAFCRLLCDENNQQVFNPASQDDINTVMSLPWPLVRKVLEEGNAINQVGDSKNP
jgi:hypothetical protein